MQPHHSPGLYAQSFITDTPADLQTEEAQYFRRTIPRFPEEGVYIYSFLESRMIYADGWEEVLGYNDDEINIHLIVKSTTPEFAPFAYEMNNKALMFIHSRTRDLEKYSFTIELKKFHKDGHEVPLFTKVGVFQSLNGKVVSIIGRMQVNRSLNFGKVMRYATYGPDKEEFEQELSKSLFKHPDVSKKEKDALSLVAKGYSFKEIASEFKVSHSAIEKRILPLYKRFDVKSLPHLVSFAYDNHILP